MLALLIRRDGGAGTAYGQNLVMAAFIIQAPRQIISKIIVANGFAGSKLAVAKQ